MLMLRPDMLVAMGFIILDTTTHTFAVAATWQPANFEEPSAVEMLTVGHTTSEWTDLF